jgi:hypothetical protein
MYASLLGQSYAGVEAASTASVSWNTLLQFHQLDYLSHSIAASAAAPCGGDEIR